jgi:ATPase subunit of ABC transporter with duplicated ATPase domains
MTGNALIFDNVSFAYKQSEQSLFEGVTFHLTSGWTALVGANGAGKTTLIEIAAGTLCPVDGQMWRPDATVYCPQRTDHPPAEISEFLAAEDRLGHILRDQLAIASDYASRWSSLSHGERKRTQIGTALWQEPSLLLVDEPTNHLDRGGQQLIFSALARHDGVGVLVSHDRHWLDELCRQTLVCKNGHVRLLPGNYTAVSEQIALEQESRSHLAREAKREQKRLTREAHRRAIEARRSDSRRSKRKLDRRDSSGRAKIDLARVTGKDGHAGRLLRQLDGRLAETQRRVESLKTEKVYAQGIWLAGERCQKDALLRLPAGEITLSATRRVVYPDIFIRPQDRIALEGSNGAGKSRLIEHLLEHLTIDKERLAFLPQEISGHESSKLLEQILELPNDELGQVLTVVRRLNSDPKTLMKSARPSPGECRKLLLALGIAKSPHLVIMDEPTNHLDLPSIECLEQALNDCPCALLLVSHDRRFLTATTDIQWRIEDDRLFIG